MKRLILALAGVALLAGGARAQDRDAVLDSLQYAGFHFFWDTANPANGLVPDRSTPNSVCSIASTGFGLSAICVGVDHGWVTRAAARQRVLATLNTFWNGPQGSQPSGVIGYRGLFYHWLDMYSATRRTDWNSELSTIDTALLFAGMLDARQYFDDPVDPDEATIRTRADDIMHRAEWDWTRAGGAGIKMGWNPDTAAAVGDGFRPFGRWGGYNEAMIMYLFAIGSPTHPVPPSDWAFWCSSYTWGQYNPSVGPYVNFAPLFGHQYSHCWVDFRSIKDPYMQSKGITYFENSRRATLSQIAFARVNAALEVILGPSNPSYRLGESDSLWGFTASDDPQYGYWDHGAPFGHDNGTITPTAAISSIPFAPDSVWPCIRNMWNHKNTVVGNLLYSYWGPYGFGDAFNPRRYQWFTTAVLGIDQGPIVLMIENYRTQAIWHRCILNPDLERGLQLAGFTPTALAVEPPGPPAEALFLAAEPNPFHGSTTLRFRIGRTAHVRLGLYDLQGRRVVSLVDAERPAGEHAVLLSGAGLAAGIYHYRLEVDGVSVVRRAVLLK